MLDWYFQTHSWNRIALTGVIVAPIAKEAVSTLTLAHAIGLPIGALTIWAIGWAAIFIGRVMQRQLRRLTTADMPIAEVT